MAQQTLSTYDEALKIDYLPVIREQLNMGTVLLTKVQRNERDVVGKQWQLVAHYKRNAGIGARPDDGSLPTAGYQAYKNPYGKVAYNYGRISITGPTISASRNDTGAIVRALESEIKGVTADVKKDVNYQLFNDGTGERCLVNGDPGTSQTLTVNTPGTNYLYEGMLVDIQDPSTGVACTASSGLTISTVDSATAVTLSAAINADVADDDRVVAYGATDGSGVEDTDCYEMMGLKGIVDDASYLTTLHNLSRDDYEWWKCATHSTDDGSGTNRDLTLDLMQASLTAAEKNGATTDLILTTYELRDAYAAILVADKRFVNTMDLDGGFKGLEYNGIPLVADADCPPNTMFFLDTSHLFLMQMSDWDWMDKRNCSSKIELFAGNSDEFDNPNYGKAYQCRQSAGKAHVISWGGIGQRWFVFDNEEANQEQAVLLPRHLDSEYQSFDYRPLCDDNLSDLWVSHRNEARWSSETQDQTLENKDFGIQEMFQVTSDCYSVPDRETGAGGAGAEILPNERRERHLLSGAIEAAAYGIAKSSETICSTIQSIEDIVRAVWRHTELGRNDLALAYC